jgi:hypothetical protein
VELVERRVEVQVFFSKLLVSDDDAVDGQLAPPFAVLLAPELTTTVRRPLPSRCWPKVGRRRVVPQP